MGGFDAGRREFHDREGLDGQPICVRFVFSELTGNIFRFEQAVSSDEGRTWEVNWVSTFSRLDP